MILLLGTPCEPPMARAIEAAEAMGLHHVVVDTDALQAWRLALTVQRDRGCTGRLEGPDVSVDLAQVSGVYVRMVGQPPAQADAARTHEALLAWADLAPVRVANRPADMMSNMSKTYQAQWIRRCGVAVPDTLVTNVPQEAQAFIAQCQAEGDEVIYKSVSGTRSIVQTFTPADADRLHLIRWCPTQFQRKVRGRDVRVHVVGEQVFATGIDSDAVDYRYARRQVGTDAVLSETLLDETHRVACLQISRMLNLPFTGIDLRIDAQGQAVCFEANPCPAYSYYESHTGVPISQALVRWLAQGAQA